jgi:hypothetical protein
MQVTYNGASTKQGSEKLQLTVELANGTIYKVYEDIVPNGKLTG